MQKTRKISQTNLFLAISFLRNLHHSIARPTQYLWLSDLNDIMSSSTIYSSLSPNKVHKKNRTAKQEEEFHVFLNRIDDEVQYASCNNIVYVFCLQFFNRRHTFPPSLYTMMLQQEYSIIQLQPGINKLGRRKKLLWSTDKSISRNMCSINVSKTSSESKLVMHVDNNQKKRPLFILHDSKACPSDAIKIEPHQG